MSAPRTVDHSQTPLVGRAQVVERITRRLLDPSAAAVRAVLLSGETGAGKSRVAGQVGQVAAEGGYAVATGRGLCLGGDSLPFVAPAELLRNLALGMDPQALDATLGPDRDVLAAIVPDFRGGQGDSEPGMESGERRVRLFQAVRNTLDRAAAKAPVLAVLEDVHWFSRTDAELLAFLLQSLPPMVALLATYRTDAAPLPLPITVLTAEARRAGLAECIELPLLSRAGVEELVSRIAGVRVDDDVVDEVFRRTDGNPFLVEELVRGADDYDALAMRLLEVATPTLVGLSATALQVVRALAVGGVAEHQVLAAVTEIDDTALVAALHEAIDAGLLRVGAGGRVYEFRHPLLADAVMADLLPGERAGWHARFARCLAERAGADPAAAPQVLTAVVRHLQGSEERAELGAWALRAAEAWERVAAFPEALQHYRLAIDAADSGPDAPGGVDWAELHARAAAVADRAGDRGAATSHVAAALAAVGDGDVRRAALLERQAWYRFLADGGGLDDIAAAMDLVAAGPPTAMRAQILITHSRLLAASGQASDALATVEEALREAADADAGEQHARAMLSKGLASWQTGDRETSEATIRRACQEAERLGDADTAGSAHVALSHLLLVSQPDPQPVLDLALTAYERLQSQGLHRQVADFLLIHAAHCCYELGRWEECVGFAERARVAGGRGARYANVLLALIAASRDQEVDEHAVVVQWRQTLDDAPALIRAQGLRVAELAMLQGRPSTAYEVAAAVLRARLPVPEPAFAGRVLAIGMQAAADMAEVARAARDVTGTARAREAAAWLAEHRDSRASTADDAIASAETRALDAAFWEAELARLHGNASAELWHRARVLAHEANRLQLAVYAMWREGARLVEARATRKSAAHVLGEARFWGSQMGDERLVSRIDVLTRAAAIPHGLSQVIDLTDGNHEMPALTAREREVLALMAQGMSNRAIAQLLVIGLKTVDSHVTHIMQKLAVHDRVAASDHARLLGLIP